MYSVNIYNTLILLHFCKLFQCEHAFKKTAYANAHKYVYKLKINCVNNP
jgi:hypothetical protein